MRRNNYARLHPLQKEWLTRVGQEPPFAENRNFKGAGPPPRVADLPPVEQQAKVPVENQGKAPGSTQ